MNEHSSLVVYIQQLKTDEQQVMTITDETMKTLSRVQVAVETYPAFPLVSIPKVYRLITRYTILKLC